MIEIPEKIKKVIIIEDSKKHHESIQKHIKYIDYNIETNPYSERFISTIGSILKGDPLKENENIQYEENIHKFIDNTDLFILDQELVEGNSLATGTNFFKRIINISNNLQNTPILFISNKTKDREKIEAMKKIGGYLEKTKDLGEVLFNEKFKEEYTKTLKNKKKLTINRTPLKVFVSYSKYDGEESSNITFGDGVNYLERLKLCLTIPIKYKGYIDIWDDTKLLPAENWNKEIKNAIEKSYIHIILVSNNLLNVNYFKNTELPLMIQKHNNKDGIVVPIFIKASNWESLPYIGEIEGFPRKGHAMDEYNGKNNVSKKWDKCREVIESVIFSRRYLI